ncbi:hypothetical protein FE634_08500 [Nocardioides dongxiaopingii]|uniref:hypothetical protein n=1 Tax=Nocardioides TaxID=1839 RepID=UPI0010C770A1|nr:MULTISPECIES: hypothetical protein [Nocardioides]QCW50433.1 hypothetical protein FE634_08500 [Nocardioides sp. S-1144]
MTTDLPAPRIPAPPSHPGPRTPVPWRGIAVEGALVLAVFALAGAVVGWLWERWVTPPEGVVFEGRWRLGYRIEGDFFVGDFDSLGHGFGVIGTFVVLGLVGGLVVGTAAALLCRRSELATLAFVAVGAVLAGVVSYRLGLALGPPDPGSAAASAADGTMLTGSLGIDGPSPFVAWPLAALVGLTFTYFLTSPRDSGGTTAGRHPS